MNMLRLIAVALPVMFLMACGGGGGGGGTAAAPTPPTPPTPNPLTQFRSSEGSSIILTIREIGDEDGASLINSNVAELGNFGSEPSTTCVRSGNGCIFQLPGSNANLGTSIDPVEDVRDLSTITNASNYFTAQSYVSTITSGVTLDGINFARGSLSGTRVGDSSLLGFETFAGWLDGSVFGTTQIAIGASGSEQYRFISYVLGVPIGSNPDSTGSATWEGATVASIKADRTFILGDATITVDFTNDNVDLMFDNWRNLDNQAVSGVSIITYNDLALSNGSFEGSGNDQVEGRFYGTNHNEVGGFFNTEMVTGAFGATRQ